MSDADKGKAQPAMTGGEALINVLEAMGVEYMFGVPGSTEAAVLDAFADNGERRLRYILSVNENVAVGMADGYARASGKIGVASVHTSVGTFIGMSNLYNAWRDRSPVVLTAGNKDSRLLTRDGFCVIPDLPATVAQMTKHTWQSQHVDQITYDMYKCVKIAQTPPPGPVYLSIPEDLLRREASQTALIQHGGATVDVVPPPDHVERAFEALVQAREPIIVAGREVARSGAMTDLCDLVSALNIPVLHEPRQSAGLMCFPNGHPLYFGMYDPSSPLVQRADVIAVFGGRVFGEAAVPPAPELPQGARLVHLHPYPEEVGRLYSTDIAVVGGMKSAVRYMLDLVNTLGRDRVGADRQGWIEEFRSENEARSASLEQRAQSEWDSRPIRVSRLAVELRNTFSEETVIVDEAVRTSRLFLNYYRFSLPGTYYRSTGGGLGWGIAAAVGVKLGQPDKRVVAVVGDGAALMNPQGLWTAARYKIPLLVVVCNNRGYLAVKVALTTYDRKAGETDLFPGTQIADPAVDFVRLGESFGVLSMRAEDPGELANVLAEAYERSFAEPVLCEVVLAAV